MIDWKLVSKKSYFGHLMKICSKGRYFLRSIHLMYHENSQKSNLERAEIVFEHFWNIAAVDSIEQHLFTAWMKSGWLFVWQNTAEGIVEVISLILSILLKGKTRARNLLEKAWMRALLKSNFGRLNFFMMTIPEKSSNFEICSEYSWL